MKLSTGSLVALVLLLASFSVAQSASGQPTTVTTSVSLTYANAQLSYPSETLPGQTVTVSAQATTKQAVRMLSLTAQIYYASNNSIRTLATVELAKNTRMDSGSQVSKDVQVTIPVDAPRTSLIGVVSETVRLTYYSYDYSYYYPYYGDYSSFGYSYYPYYYYMYPSYGYSDMTDESLAPLSYIRATTPEYVSLQSEYQMLQVKLNQTQAENQQLQQTVKSQQDSISGKNSMIADLNQQLASAQNMITMLEVVAVVLVVVVVAMTFYLWRRTAKRAEAGTSPAESAET